MKNINSSFESNYFKNHTEKEGSKRRNNVLDRSLYILLTEVKYKFNDSYQNNITKNYTIFEEYLSGRVFVMPGAEGYIFGNNVGYAIIPKKSIVEKDLSMRVLEKMKYLFLMLMIISMIKVNAQ